MVGDLSLAFKISRNELAMAPKAQGTNSRKDMSGLSQRQPRKGDLEVMDGTCLRGHILMRETDKSKISTLFGEQFGDCDYETLNLFQWFSLLGSTRLYREHLSERANPSMAHREHF